MSQTQPHNHDGAEDCLDRATTALKDMRIPAGPPAELVDRTIAALWAAEFKTRKLQMRPFIKFAMAASIALIVGTVLFVAPPWGSHAAFADVLQKMQQVRTMRCKLTSTVTVLNMPNPVTQNATMIIADNRIRQDMGMVINVMDYQNGEALTLVPAQKQATRMHMDNVPKETANINILESFRAMQANQGKPIGQKQINGVAADGFRVDIDGQAQMQMTIWVDPKTRLPVELETIMEIPQLPKSQT